MTTAKKSQPQSSLLNRVQAAMTVHEVEAALTTVAAARAAANLPPASVIEDATTALLSGAGPECLANLGQTIRDRDERHAAHAAQMAALDDIAQKLRAEGRKRSGETVGRGVELLQTELARVLDAAEPVLAELGDHLTAEDSIAHGVADAWQTTRTLAAQHTEIRSIQAYLAARVLDEQPTGYTVSAPLRQSASKRTRTLVLTFGTVRDFGRRYPGGYVAPTPTLSGTHIIRTADASGQPTALPWDTGNPNADLCWLVKHRESVWLPTVQELQDAAEPERRRDPDDVAEMFAEGRAAQRIAHKDAERRSLRL